MSERRKTSDQIKIMREVQRAAELAMQEVVNYLKTAKCPSSEEAHRIIDRVLEENNCESPEGHIVAGGLQSFEPHEKGIGVLEKGTPIVIDIYPRSKTFVYFADISRTVCIGVPPAELQKMYNAVLEAQKLAISMIKPGIRCSDIQNTIERFFAVQGYETSGKGTLFKFAKGFVHSLGHGVGLNIHEAPHIGRGSDDILEEGDVVTIEPGLYYPHVGGIRIEDMLYVTSSGALNLANFPKNLVV